MDGPNPPSEQRPHALGSRYELEERLGIGAMGEVWRALDRQTGRHLAAKVLRAEYAHDTDIITRFIQERSILVSLTHPNIVRVRDLVVEGDRLAIVMDLVEGGDLRKHLREQGPIAPEHAVALACVVLDALASAHAAGCLHRDVKPDNVLLLAGDVTRPQDARLSDFSIARLAQESTVQSTGLLGTPGYMPPELFRDGQFSGASDVYATGILLYELIGGRTPFAGSGTAHTIGNRHVSSAPPPLPVAAPLWALIDQMLAKEPRARLGASATAAALRALPTESLSSEPLPPQPVPDSWESVDFTVLRGSSLQGRHTASERDLDSFSATTGADTGPLGRRSTGSPAPSWSPPGPPSGSQSWPQSTPPAARRRPVWVAWAVGAAAVLLVAVASITFASTRGGEPTSADPSEGSGSGVGAQAVSAQLPGSTLPVGLTVDRSATYDPASDKLDLTITYSAGSTPLEGPFLEVFPPGTEGGECPLAAWEGGEQTRNVTSSTGVLPDVDCDAYSVAVPPIPARGSQQVGVVLSGIDLDLADDPDAVAAWLSEEAAAGSRALAGSSVRDDQFPAQRTTGIWLELSPFSVPTTGSIRAQIGPFLGSEERGPAFFDSQDVSGQPSGFLQQIAGGFDGVRLSSGCSEVEVDDYLEVRPVRKRRQCTIEAEVGELDRAADKITVTGSGS